jgi:osmotically-inducible protein OsmY
LSSLLAARSIILNPSSIPLLHRVDTALRENPHLQGRHVLLEDNEGTVTLRGTVESYYQKQMAQESLRAIDGVERILNQLEVVNCDSNVRFPR